MTKQEITEDSGVHEQWYEQAADESMTLETLPEFLRHLTEDYEHDYGTICHAFTAGALATMWAMNRAPQGGITGFQAGAIMWGFIRHWTHKAGPLRMVEYENMLYPQYHEFFEKTIDAGTWDWLQKTAAERLAKSSSDTIDPDIRQHMEDIVAGTVPFGYKVLEEYT